MGSPSSKTCYFVKDYDGIPRAIPKNNLKREEKMSITIQVENVSELKQIFTEMFGQVEIEVVPAPTLKKGNDAVEPCKKESKPVPKKEVKKEVKKEEYKVPTPEAVLEKAKSMLQANPGLKATLKTWLDEIGTAKITALNEAGRITIMEKLEAL